MISGISSILELAPFKFASEGFTGLIGKIFQQDLHQGLPYIEGGGGCT